VNHKNTSRNAKRLGSLAIFLIGLGIGVLYSALSLAPKTSVAGDKYMQAAVIGMFILIVGSVINLIARWKQVRLLKQINLDELARKD